MIAQADASIAAGRVVDEAAVDAWIAPLSDSYVSILPVCHR
jgi:hypothetical protein